MNVRTREFLSPHDRLALINLESLFLTKRCVRHDKGCVFTIGVVAHSLGVDEAQVRAFTDKRSADYDPGFPPPRGGSLKYRGEVHHFWFARDLLDYCQSLVNGLSELQTKPNFDVRCRSEQGARP